MTSIMQPLQVKSIILGLCIGALASFFVLYYNIEMIPAEKNAQVVFGYASAVDKASPSIVKITTTDANGGHYNLGSGVIIHPSGLIVTNFHVVSTSSTLRVTTAAGAKVSGSIIGKDKESDLAFLKIAGTDYPAISFATKPAEVGDIALALGHPFSVGQTVTQGIISGLKRDNLGLNTYENFIQTDAAINPGNSGGALINIKGELVGINTATFGENGLSQGIGFAIPIMMVKSVVNDILQHGHAVRGYLGISARPLTPQEKQFYNLYTNNEALLVTDIQQGSPATSAGIKRGDVIVKIDNKSITRAIDASNLVGNAKPGDKVSLSIRRGQNSLEINTILATRPTN